MVAKVCLTEQENSYYLLTYPTSEKDPLYRIGFLYHDCEKEEVLVKARDFGQKMAESLGCELIDETKKGLEKLAN